MTLAWSKSLSFPSTLLRLATSRREVSPEGCEDTRNQFDCSRASLVAQTVKNLPAGDLGLTPGLGRSLGGGHGYPLQCSCLENPHGQRSLAGYSPWSQRLRQD